MPAHLRMVTLAICLALSWRPGAAQQDDDLTAEALRGLPPVWLLVESVDDALKSAGLGEDQLRIGIAARLRTAGLSVVTRGAGIRSDAPFLYLSLQASKTDKGDYAFVVELRLNESVRLVRDSTVQATAVTWATPGAFGTVAPDELETLQSWVDEFVDAFISAYRAANRS